MKTTLLRALIDICSFVVVMYIGVFLGATHTVDRIEKACNVFNNFTVDNVNYVCKIDEQVKGLNE